MPGLVDDEGDAAPPVDDGLQYNVHHQKVDLDIDFAARSLKGSTEITIQPWSKELRHIRLNCRQCEVTSAQVNGLDALIEYDDPYRRLRMPPSATVHQYEMLRNKLVDSVGASADPELTLKFHKNVKVNELAADPATALPQYNGTPSLQRQESDAMAVAETPTTQTALSLGPKFSPFKVYVEFEIKNFRDGIHFVGFEEGDSRYPYLYTKNSTLPGLASSIFPCMEDASVRCSWEVSIRSPRTLGDAFRKPNAGSQALDGSAAVNGASDPQAANIIPAEEEEYYIDLSEEEKVIELTILCSGDTVDEVIDVEDETRKTLSFQCQTAISARHIGFAIGPFEHVDLSAFRDNDEEEKLGQSAVKVDGYCLPGRAAELRNTCFPVTQAMDYFSITHTSFPFGSYRVCFVDDMVTDTASSAGLSFCSTRLLFPDDIIEPLDRNTRILVHEVATQWMGVYVVPKDPVDAWVVTGISYFITDLFMKKLAGNNEYRYRQKLASEKIYELDVDRPSIYDLGAHLHVDPFELEFLSLKSAAVLFILDRRLMKATGSTGVSRVINTILRNVRSGKLVNGQLSTADFQRTCEKLTGSRLDAFFSQWVLNAGLPVFEIVQNFNKKKLCVNMTITQKQGIRLSKPAFEPNVFMREVKEHVGDVWAGGVHGGVQPLFTGPMTIRIHEADGTPYEHIVEINQARVVFDIPYNTKYKRLKRSKRQKERAQANSGMGGGEDSDDVLLYCLGDVLQSQQEVEEWKIMEWSKEDEDKMGQESYEWIRMDADFEWLGKMHLKQPAYMYVSQLQQDRDVVAQYESVAFINQQIPHPLGSSILLRTVMDRRYFHGIRTLAAAGLARCATHNLMYIGQFHLEKIFQDLFCFENSTMPRSNNFSDRINFIMQCAIPRAMANIRDPDGNVPMSVRRFFVDKLRFNDNSNNDFSDCHYVATLMRCLADSLVATAKAKEERPYTFSFGDEEQEEEDDPDAQFQVEAISEIERYRRIDEWISSYHNVYSTTALECLERLTRVGVVKDKTKEVLQYTKGGNADNVRIMAFSCLAETGVTRNMTVMKYLLHSLVDDPSPFFRDRLLRCFGRALGHIALSDSDVVQPKQAPTSDEGLQVIHDVNTDDRNKDMKRKSSVEGALAALKEVLINAEVFKKALWFAATSPTITVVEVVAFLDIAALIYIPTNALVIKLNYPRPFRAEHLGNMKMRFFRTDRPYRTSPTRPLSVEHSRLLQNYGLRYTGLIVPEAQEAKKMTLKLPIPMSQTSVLPNTQYHMSPPPLPTPIQGGVKLNLGKRKQSLAPRDESPKPPKMPKQQTPNVAAQTSKAKSSPSVNKRRSSTPASRPSPAPSRPTGQKIIKLRLGGNAQRVEDILSRPSQPGPMRPLPLANAVSQARSITPLASQQSGAVLGQSMLQSPTSTFQSPFALTQTPIQPTLNLGGFRSYGPAPDANVKASGVKQEEAQDHGTSNGASSASPAPTAQVKVEGEQPMAPPRKKLTLKLGSRAGSQASPQ